MTDTNEPVVPPTPPATPQPYASQPYAPPPAPTRNTGKFAAGLVLTIIGGLWTLGGLFNIVIAAAAFADNPGYAIGRFVGGVLLPIAVLVVGIVLLRGSRPKA
jgi:hypothetical protein